jgi:hypothetical protein
LSKVTGTYPARDSALHAWLPTIRRCAELKPRWLRSITPARLGIDYHAGLLACREAKDLAWRSGN